jgi:hypothetical protein
MSQIIDDILREVSLDDRVSDGIFRMDENTHMDALRDHFVKRGLTLEDAVSITNKMLEGKYPERQIYQKNTGILVTFPTPQHKAKAVHENPGKYVEYNPFPKKENPTANPEKEPKVEPDVKPKDPLPPPKELTPQSVFQNGEKLSVEPIRGSEKPESPSTPISPVVAPMTPGKKEAHKTIVKQMIQGDDMISSKFYPSIAELYQQATQKGLTEVIEFLKPYVSS